MERFARGQSIRSSQDIVRATRRCSVRAVSAIDISREGKWNERLISYNGKARRSTI